MKKLTTAMIAGVGVATIGGAGLGLANVSAMQGGAAVSSGWNAYVGNEHDAAFDAELSARLATEYNLEHEEVAALVEQIRDDQFNLLSDERLTRLEQAVENETLTQDEYDYIVKKLEDADNLIDQVDDATGEERRKLAKEIRGELRSLAEWMKERDLNVQLLAGATLGLKHHNR